MKTELGQGLSAGEMHLFGGSVVGCNLDHFFAGARSGTGVLVADQSNGHHRFLHNRGRGGRGPTLHPTLHPTTPIAAAVVAVPVFVFGHTHQGVNDHGGLCGVHQHLLLPHQPQTLAARAFYR